MTDSPPAKAHPLRVAVLEVGAGGNVTTVRRSPRQ
jgi:hypothetical protein